jgi:AbrB family looped-hinge helix DNA binding protein
MDDDLPMITTVTQKNMVTIPAEVGRKLGIRPGWKLDWQPVEGREEILVRVIPDRGELARRLTGICSTRSRRSMQKSRSPLSPSAVKWRSGYPSPMR